MSRVGWDKGGQNILANHASDPSNSDPLRIVKEKVQYGKDTPSLYISPILSPIDNDLNSVVFYGPKGETSPLDASMTRNNNTAQGTEFHVGGIYINDKGATVISGAYGCYSVVDCSQVADTPEKAALNSPSNTYPSNSEMARFGNAVNTAKELDKNENMTKSSRDTQVEINKRNYDKKRKEQHGTKTSLPKKT